MEKIEYEWVKQTRQILLDQCRELNEDVDLCQYFGHNIVKSKSGFSF